MLRYLRRVDDVTQRRLRWGILTNGRLAAYIARRAFCRRRFPRIDLGKVLDFQRLRPDLLDKRPDASPIDARMARSHAFKLFVVLLFGREAFLQ